VSLVINLSPGTSKTACRRGRASAIAASVMGATSSSPPHNMYTTTPPHLAEIEEQMSAMARSMLH
jgi:hypothetical protein